MASSSSSSSCSGSSSGTLALNHTPTISLALAQHALSSALSYASSRNLRVNISIHSASLHLLAFAAMDGAKFTSIDIAHSKSFTAAGHGLPTSGYGNKAEPGGGVYGIQHSNGGRFSTIRGGVPVVVHGRTVGGVGVSGAMPGEDEEIAQAGVDAIMEVLNIPKARQ